MADLERGQRIKELREARHLTQEAMAEALPVTIRGYQEWEAGGGIKWENVKKLAKFHGVEPDFVMNGPKPATPDLLGSAEGDRLRQLEQDMGTVKDALVQILERLERMDRARAGRVASSSRSKTPRKTAGSQRKAPAKRKRQAGG